MRRKSELPAGISHQALISFNLLREAESVLAWEDSKDARTGTSDSVGCTVLSDATLCHYPGVTLLGTMPPEVPSFR